MNQPKEISEVKNALSKYLGLLEEKKEKPFNLSELVSFVIGYCLAELHCHPDISVSDMRIALKDLRSTEEPHKEHSGKQNGFRKLLIDSLEVLMSRYEDSIIKPWVSSVYDTDKQDFRRVNNLTKSIVSSATVR